MKNIFIIIVLLLSGCSLKTPANQAQYEATNAFSSYTKNFLNDEVSLAKNDINRAINHAKKNANLDDLARIYLGECALNISVGIKDSCDKYNNIKELVDDSALESYHALITKQIVKKQIDKLPIVYKAFANQFVKHKYNNAFSEILMMNNEVSQLISSSLIKKHLHKNQIEKIIAIASFHGYKKSILFWLNELKKITKDKIIRKRIEKKIYILKS